eukprot:755054-Rhodomonas_salina.10
MPDTNLRNATRCPVLTNPPMMLRLWYAVFGTEKQKNVYIVLRCSYAVSGTDVRHTATTRWEKPISAYCSSTAPQVQLLPSYALSGAILGLAMHCLVVA